MNRKMSAQLKLELAIGITNCHTRLFSHAELWVSRTQLTVIPDWREKKLDQKVIFETFSKQNSHSFTKRPRIHSSPTCSQKRFVKKVLMVHATHVLWFGDDSKGKVSINRPVLLKNLVWIFLKISTRKGVEMFVKTFDIKVWRTQRKKQKPKTFHIQNCCNCTIKIN